MTSQKQQAITEKKLTYVSESITVVGALDHHCVIHSIEDAKHLLQNHMESFD